MGWRSREAENDFENQRREMNEERARRKPNPHIDHEIYREQKYLPQEYVPQQKPQRTFQPQTYQPQQTRNTPKNNGKIAGIFILVVVVICLLSYLFISIDTNNSNKPEDSVAAAESRLEMLAAANVGDMVLFGSNCWWYVIDKQYDKVLLDWGVQETFAAGKPQEMLAQLNELTEHDSGVALFRIELSQMEYNSILDTPIEIDGATYLARVFPLSEEQMKQYGIDVAVDADDTAVTVRPAIWVSILEAASDIQEATDTAIMIY